MKPPERYANVPPLTTLSDAYFKEGQDEARKSLLGFLDGTHRSVVLIGGVGSGKTHMAAATYFSFIAQDDMSTGMQLEDGTIERFKRHMCFVNVPKFVADIKRGFGYSADEHRRVAEIEHLLDECRCVVLDDLGAERATDFSNEQLLLLVDGLYNRSSRVIVTTNVKMSVLAETGGARLVSRIAEGAKVTNVVTRDLRVGNGK
jgi:DNA replication protein DnaC